MHETIEQFIQRLYRDPEMLRMGHCQRLEDLNLGLGWIYYGLVRTLRPARVVVIGSFRGFVPAVMARALLDNAEGGELVFIDPSYANDQWTDPARVHAWFAELGVPNVRHHLHTTQSFLATPEYEALQDIGLLMVDGYHSAEQARVDYLAFLPKLGTEALVMFHDSLQQRSSDFYGEHHRYEHNVCLLIERLRATAGLEVLTLPFGPGLSLLRGRPASLELIQAPWPIPEAASIGALAQGMRTPHLTRAERDAARADRERAHG